MRLEFIGCYVGKFYETCTLIRCICISFFIESKDEYAKNRNAINYDQNPRYYSRFSVASRYALFIGKRSSGIQNLFVSLQGSGQHGSYLHSELLISKPSSRWALRPDDQALLLIPKAYCN